MAFRVREFVLLAMKLSFSTLKKCSNLILVWVIRHEFNKMEKIVIICFVSDILFLVAC